jgi:hypothetical protein
MRATRLLRAAAAATFLLAAGACAHDDSAAADAAPAAHGAALPEADAGEPEEIRVTPAESAAAVRRVRSRADSVRRAAQRNAGVTPDDEPRPPRAAPEPSAEEEHAACMAQAQQAEGRTRTLIEEGCERRRLSRTGS